MRILDRRNLPALAVLAGILVACPLEAQDLRVAVVNTRRLARESRMGTEGLERIRTMGERLRAGVESRQKAYQRELQEFRSRALTMSPDVREQKQEDLERRGIDLKRAAEDARLEIEREGKKIEEEIQKEVLAGLQEYARNEGYDLVLDHLQCLYNSPTTDITEQVVRYLDSRKGR